MEPLAPGDPARIGPFRLVARLGRGGMGRVYLGRAESTGRSVAVKTIHSELLVDPEFRTRFSHEVSAARRVRDEYIAEVVDADPDGPTPWLATAYVPGISVEDAVRRFGPLPAESVRILGVCVARAVAAIHAVGLVHRDLKPGNVLLTAAGPKVIDFGIARGVSDASLTRTGMVAGSPPYMAPEQLTNGRFGPGSDVFSLAAILHYAATATGPCGHGGAQEQYARAVAAGPLLDPSLPHSLAEAVGRCFITDPDARPSAADLARALEWQPGERPSPGWLPSAVMSDILTQATDALNKDSASGVPMPRDGAQPHAQAHTQAYAQAQAQAQAHAQRAAAPAPTRVETPPPFAPPTPHMHTPRPNAPYPTTPYGNAPYSSTPPRPYPVQSQPQYPYQQTGPGTGAGPMLPYGYRPAVISNGMATTALVLALVGIVVPCLLPIALPFGFVGMSKATKLGVGRGQAISATIISAILIAGWAILIALVSNSN